MLSFCWTRCVQGICMGTPSLRLEGRLEMQQWRRTLRQHKLAFMKCVCPIHCNRRIPFNNHYGNPLILGPFTTARLSTMG